MRNVLGQLWSTLAALLGMVHTGAEAGQAVAEWAKEAAEELRDEARIERSKRAEMLINGDVIDADTAESTAAITNESKQAA